MTAARKLRRADRPLIALIILVNRHHIHNIPPEILTIIQWFIRSSLEHSATTRLLNRIAEVSLIRANHS